MRCVGRRLQLAHALPGEFSVVIILEPPQELLVIGPCHGRVVIFLRQAGSPVERRWNFSGGRVVLDLLLKAALRLGVPPLPQGKPGSLPVRVRGAPTAWKALLQFAVSIDG